MDYAEAVKSIRHQLFLRAKGFCELCGDIVLESSGHMHEQKHRGKGGEISLENSVFICPICHGLAHKDRNPHWVRKDLTFKDVSRKM
jgi:5-methylcytosine-specific restriction endonuclease McrA